MLLFQQIEDMAYRHTDARRSIGEFLLSEKDHVEHCSMQEIAARTFTSKSSLVRFAKNLGFHGWKEFMAAFLSELHYEAAHYNDVDPNFPFEENDSMKDIVYKISSLSVEGILDTADQINIRSLELAVSMLVKAERIALFGQPPNTYVASLFKRKMLSIGIPVLLSDVDRGLLARSLSAKDCAILISYTGNNEDRVPINLIPYLRERDVPIIGITGMGDNLLRRRADVVLSMSSRERLYTKIATFATEESLNYILNLLFAGCFVHDYKKNLEHKIKASMQLEKRYTRNLDMREEAGEERPQENRKEK